MRADGHGKPVALHLTGGEPHDSMALSALLDTGAIHLKRGRSRLRPRRVAGDKAFAGKPSRTHLRSRGIGAAIPTKSNQPRAALIGRRIGRAIGWAALQPPQAFPSHRPRYENRAHNNLAMLHVAATTLWL